jgi:hypothetical protein
MPDVDDTEANDLTHADATSTDVVYMLTTEDNPFSPFDQFHLWWVYDETSEHHSCGLLARYLTTSPELPQWMQDEARHEAIDAVIENAIHARFKKVTRADYPDVPQEPEFVVKDQEFL